MLFEQDLQVVLAGQLLIFTRQLFSVDPDVKSVYVGHTLSIASGRRVQLLLDETLALKHVFLFFLMHALTTFLFPPFFVVLFFCVFNLVPAPFSFGAANRWIFLRPNPAPFFVVSTTPF